ncbi:hypothetical protein LMG7974_01164 [Campylobacter majalis]|uniref:Lipoprotein n=1 Tax=Campylobacter majalis TaxID=2790656 RepID=A0ABN7KAD3_9BACT|nr:hypothetical protein LMG7974_01164 [Campylobacter majalis]
MKDLVILAFVALSIFGCSALISVGDNNSNTHTYLKDKK